MLQSNEAKQEELQTRLIQSNYTFQRVADETGYSRQHIYNQLRGNKKLNYEFVAKVENLLTEKTKGVLELMAEVKSLLEQFNALEKDCNGALRDRTLTDAEVNNIESKKNLIKSRLDEVVSVIKDHKNQKLEV